MNFWTIKKAFDRLGIKFPLCFGLYLDPVSHFLDHAHFPEDAHRSLLHSASLVFTPTLEHYKVLFTISAFLKSFANSAIIALLSTAIIVFFSTLPGYAYSRFDFPWKKGLCFFPPGGPNVSPGRHRPLDIRDFPLV